MEYDFTLGFALPDEDSDLGSLVERLAEAGCDDATVGIGRPGRVALDFTREAASANAAILDWIRGRNAYPVGEAIRDVAHATMQLNLAREAPSLMPGIGRALRQVTR